MNLEKRIFEKLQEKFQPEFLEVKNNSALHRGHLGHDGSDQTHFQIIIKCQELKKINRIKAHKEINNLFLEDFKKQLHALEIKII